MSYLSKIKSRSIYHIPKNKKKPTLDKKLRKFLKRGLTRVQKFAFNLKQRDIKAENWFWNEWNYIKWDDKSNSKDYSNEPFRDKFIPDVINYHFKYIIEIDEPHHQTNQKQIYIDKLKDKYYTKYGYTIFRIRAYNQTDFNEVVNKIRLLRKRPKLTTILRKKNTL